MLNFSYKLKASSDTEILILLIHLSAILSEKERIVNRGRAAPPFGAKVYFRTCLRKLRTNQCNYFVSFFFHHFLGLGLYIQSQEWLSI